MSNAVRIDIEKLHPRGVEDKAAELRKQEIARYLDQKTGMLREDISEYTNCMLCDQDDTEPVFVKEGFRYVRCKACGLVYINPRLSRHEIEKVYSTGRFAFVFTDLYIPSAKYRQEVLYQERLDLIEGYIPCGRLLDVGSATGHFVQSALERGWDAYGVETAKVAADYAKNELQLRNIHNMTLQESQFQDEFFDVVTLWDVLDHVPDPLGVVREVYRILRKDGMIFVYVPNLDSIEKRICREKCDGICPDVHLIYFDPDTVRKLLEKAGFEIVYLATRGIDIDHIIFNIKHYVDKKYNTEFISDHKYILQEAFDKAGLGNWVRIFGKKGRPHSIQEIPAGA